MLPPHIQNFPSRGLIHQHFLDATARPRAQTTPPNLTCKRLWKNIASWRLTSGERSDLYLLINEKTEHRRLMHVIQRADRPNCLHCAANEETLTHKFSECPRVAAAWAHTQQRLMQISGGRLQLSFSQLFRPVLIGLADETRVKLLKTFIKYIVFVDNCATIAIDVAALDFELSLL